MESHLEAGTHTLVPQIFHLPSEVYMLSDYMSGLVLQNQHQAAGKRCLTWHPIMWTVLGFQPVRLKVITGDSKGLLASVGSHKCCSAAERMGL